MKKLIVMALLSCFAASAFAKVGIEWNTQTPGIFWYGQAGTSSSTEVLALNKSDILWQLIYAGADNKIDPVNKEDPEISLGKVYGDDEVWKERLISQNTDSSLGPKDVMPTAASDETTWQVRGINASGNTVYTDLAWETAGFVYQRVWGSIGSDGATDEQGLYYYESGLTELNLGYDPKGAAQVAYLNPVKGQGAVLNNFIPTPEVPEPATMSLLGLGALAMVLRRKLRK